MPYWLITAAVAVAALATVTWLLHRTVRKNCPYLVGRTLAAAALARLAKVSQGTEVDIVGGELRELVREPSLVKLIETWLRKGAVVRCMVHLGDGEGESVLRKLAARGHEGGIRLFVLRERERGSEMARDAKEFHFAVFCGPDQLWLEGSHPAGEALARDCEYVPRASSDERWKARREDFTVLTGISEEIDLTKGG